ncbi:hypothetical protein D3C72_2411720 [compost metagenome]
MASSEVGLASWARAAPLRPSSETQASASAWGRGCRAVREEEIAAEAEVMRWADIQGSQALRIKVAHAARG